MKIIILDSEIANPGDLSWADIEALGEVTVYPTTKREETIARIGTAEAVISNKIVLDKKIIEACPNLKYIGLLSTGYNLIDTQVAKKHGIVVANVPGYSSYGVAQHTLSLLLELTNHVGHHSAAVKAGRWEEADRWSFWDYPLTELVDKTIGIIGFGNIGMLVGKISSAMGMKVLATGSHPTSEGMKIAEYTTLNNLLNRADVISLHCPLLPQTENIICKANIEKMKHGVIILNTARGGLVVEEDLAEALISGKVSAAGLDVVRKEPIPAHSPLMKAPNCYITPHIAWVSIETRRRLIKEVANNLKAFQEGRPVNQVNL